MIMFQFRWTTKVLFGAWCATHQEALHDAFKHGQAIVGPTKGDLITTQDFASIEKR
jgi:hypothetical protein